MKNSAWLLGLVIFIAVIASGCNNTANEEKEGQPLDGKWTGSIKVPGQALDIIVTLKHENEWSGTISIPVQGVNDYPLSSVSVNGKNVAFFMEIQSQQLSFDGEYQDEVIKGSFSQQGQTFPFKLTKGGPVTENDEDFLHIDTNEGTLYGELEKPDGDGPFPVMLIIPGSGPTDRNGNSAGIQGANNSLKMLAEELAENGIASVRYDKRGVKKNLEASIPEDELKFDQFVNDAAAWTNLLASKDLFSEIGIIGHSQGSLVGMLAAQKGNADVLISLAGAGRPIDQVLNEQLENQLSDESLKEAESIFEKLKAGEQVKEISQELQSVFRPSVQGFLASWMHYDPAEEIADLEIPALLVGGGLDLQVAAREAKLLHEANPDAELMLIDKMNHILKEAPKEEQGNLETYSNPDILLAEGLMEGILDFLKEKEIK